MKIKEFPARAPVTMLQITPKSRSEVPEYARMQREKAPLQHGDDPTIEEEEQNGQIASMKSSSAIARAL
jgi:hypothetical protein